MCGIAGVVDASLPPAERALAVERMCAAMVHRGPDDGGAETRGSSTIGMRRLAIFDPANGRQPMSTVDGRFHLVFNGAIYNFRDLRQELSGLGHSFRTDCDTEVLLAAFAQWRERCVDRLRGMFAFAVWDAQEEKLFLARDPFGIKPLYYRRDGLRLIFASELNALLASGLFSADIDPQSVADYLGWFAVPAPRTIYRDVVCLRPGECATYQNGRFNVASSWSFRSLAQNAQPCRSQAEFEEALRHRLEDTIRAHMMADVPVGAFLSGGIDSAAIVGLMSKLTGRPLKTFTISFPEAEHDEAGEAAETARHFGTDHHTRILTGADVAADLPALLASFDQPTGDGINTYYASQAARAGGVTVALSGLGGDELFGGYPYFRDIPRVRRWLPFWDITPPPVRRRILRNLRGRGARHRKLADILERARSLHEVCSMQRRVFSESRRRELLNPDVCSSLARQDCFHPQLATLSADLAVAGVFDTISGWELRTYMADVLLRDSDVMSMRHSLELRVPFVDRPFLEFLWGQPERFKDDRRRPKSALARSIRDLLPSALHARPKRGFSPPFALWTRRELRPFLEETFSRESVGRTGLFSSEAVPDFWQEYLAKGDAPQWSRVWSLAMLIEFVNRRRPASQSSCPAARAAAPITIADQQTSASPCSDMGRMPMPRGTGILPVDLQKTEMRPWSSGDRLAKLPPAATRATGRAARRTLLLAPELFESEGGIPRILQLYLKALCDLATADDRVRFVALNDTVVDSGDLRRCAGGQLAEWRVCSRNKLRFIRGALALSRGYDLVVCGHVAQLPVALLAKALNPRLRYYLVAHGIEVWRPFTFAERLALQRASRIFCVSEYTRQQVLQRSSVPADRAVVLYNALDPSFAIAPGLPRNGRPPVILVVSRITKADRYKGVEHMLEAMRAIRARVPTAILRIIGRGDDLARLHDLREKLGLTKAVELLGYVDDRRMQQELRGCSLFALPSKKEGFGLVFLEAMANGRPCLGARAGGVPEVITDETGVLVEYGNVPAIADACVGALQREWNEAMILDRAHAFSYPIFKARLASLLET